jgi:undecaprenyl pyrophosphate phosphatase UppP
MVAGLLRGLDHEDAARFSFLLATPVIFAAGVYRSLTCSAPRQRHPSSSDRSASLPRPAPTSPYAS